LVRSASLAKRTLNWPSCLETPAWVKDLDIISPCVNVCVSTANYFALIKL